MKRKIIRNQFRGEAEKMHIKASRYVHNEWYKYQNKLRGFSEHMKNVKIGSKKRRCKSDVC